MENIAVLGSTGSVGRSALEVIKRMPHKFQVVGLAAGRNTELLRKQVEKFRPRIVSLRREEEAREFKRLCQHCAVEVLAGDKGAEQVAGFDQNDIVVSAITGINGLRPTLSAVRAGKKVALANKESMVVAGPLIQASAEQSGAQIVPVDSEHSGIFQCLAKERKEDIKKVILTASGGPFFHTPPEEMGKKTLEEALVHPRWKMGKKVTIDSATLMNKGLELIEARWLFGLKPRQMDILIHPQSIVHSLVELKDGSVLAQLSPTDMKIPIQFALTYPQREEAILPSLDLSRVRVLEFYRVKAQQFPLLLLARQALEEGESVPVALNAANEMAVNTFLEKKIGFADISEVITEVMHSHHKRKVRTVEDIFDVDRETRALTSNSLKRRY
ncbi:MAG: 1-deoxy-D-xylulose-5-phosphate reductoisomerase [Candidatus Aminicenantes bacterium]